MDSLHLLQARYWDSLQSFESAKLIVARKCWNMAHLIASRLPYRRSAYPAQAETLSADIRVINRNLATINSANNRRALMLIEGRATRAYWRAFTVFARTPTGWARAYPHASDILNQALNIGYTALANIIRERVRQYDISPEIGMFHTPHDGKEALIYDLEELYRQPVVDCAVLAVFVRSVPHDDCSAVLHYLFRRLKSRVYFEGGLWKLSDVIDSEIGNYVEAIKLHRTFIPYRFSWSHKKYASRDRGV